MIMSTSLFAHGKFLLRFIRRQGTEKPPTHRVLYVNAPRACMDEDSLTVYEADFLFWPEWKRLPCAKC